jgi:hypothetical protein
MPEGSAYICLMEIRFPHSKRLALPRFLFVGGVLGLLALPACIPTSHKLLDQSRALRWQQDSLALVAQVGKVSEGEKGQALAVARLDSVNLFLKTELETTQRLLNAQTRRADTLLGQVQNEGVLRDLLRMDLAEAQAAAAQHQKRADSLLIEVEFLKQPKPTKPAAAKPSQGGAGAKPAPRK